MKPGPAAVRVCGDGELRGGDGDDDILRGGSGIDKVAGGNGGNGGRDDCAGEIETRCES